MWYNGGMKKTPQEKYEIFIKSFTDPGNPLTYNNASASAREAGYSPKSAHIVGSKLKKKLSEEIQVARGRAVDVNRKNFHRDKEELINKIADDIKILPSTHSNKPKLYDLISKLRAYYNDQTKVETVLSIKHADELNNIAIAIAQRITKKGE